MNKSGFFLLVGSIIIATLTLWINTYWTSNKGFQFIQKDKKIDFYLSNFTLLDTHSDGSLRYLIKGKHLIFQQSTKEAELIKPIIEAQNSHQEITTITAEKAVQKSSHGQIVLEGNVDIKKDAIKPEDSISFQTNNLIYDPLKKTLSSNSPTVLVSDFLKIHGTGLSINLDEEEIRILSNVQTEFNPN